MAQVIAEETAAACRLNPLICGLGGFCVDAELGKRQNFVESLL
jgi:hypothetical protein